MRRLPSMDIPLYAEPFTMKHLGSLQQWLIDPAVHRHLYTLYRPMDLDELARWLQREQDGGARMFFYRSTPEASAGTAAGMGLVHYIHPKHRCGELSIIVNPVCAGNGFGRRILLHLMDCAFREHGLHKLFFHCAGPNTRMIDIAGKAGFVLEGVYREEIHLDDTWHNTCRFGMLESEYTAFLARTQAQHNVID
jgi:RimJ/RimL family protein N-acetyltransferase